MSADIDSESEAEKTVPVGKSSILGCAIVLSIAALQVAGLVSWLLVGFETPVRICHAVFLIVHLCALTAAIYFWRPGIEFVSVSSDGWSKRVEFVLNRLLPVVVVGIWSMSVVALLWPPAPGKSAFAGIAFSSSALLAFVEVFLFLKSRGDVSSREIYRSMKSKNYERALELLEPKIAGDATSPHQVMDAATCHMRLGNFEEANKLAERAVAISDRQPSLLNNVAVLYFEQNRFEEALVLLDEAEIKDRKHFLFWNKCFCLHKLNRTEEARVAWSQLKKTAKSYELRSLRSDARCQEIIKDLENGSR
ncbi:MAG: Anaphase-promoting complex, cyclosome, subunit 3 [Schlesneria sp.]|nr:Anaphase-promoting complex, cyclosome, subunit 3 [Schlesneria sp.]